MMRTVTIHEAKTYLSALLRDVEAGETVIVARGNTPIARLTPYETESREFDQAPDLVVRMESDFDDPLDDFGPYMIAAEDPS